MKGYFGGLLSFSGIQINKGGSDTPSSTSTGEKRGPDDVTSPIHIENIELAEQLPGKSSPVKVEDKDEHSRHTSNFESEKPSNDDNKAGDVEHLDFHPQRSVSSENRRREKTGPEFTTPSDDNRKREQPSLKEARSIEDIDADQNREPGEYREITISTGESAIPDDVSNESKGKNEPGKQLNTVVHPEKKIIPNDIESGKIFYQDIRSWVAEGVESDFDLGPASGLREVKSDLSSQREIVAKIPQKERADLSLVKAMPPRNIAERKEAAEEMGVQDFHITIGSINLTVEETRAQVEPIARRKSKHISRPAEPTSWPRLGRHYIRLE